MSRRPERGPEPLPHENPDVFRDSIQYTAARTGFPADLIEKDYFCSLVLAYLYGGEGSGNLVFKGGTALNKVHLGFYRLSEDLDFSVPVEVDSSRGDRRRAKAAVEKRIGDLTGALPSLSFKKPWTGANNSTQYLAEVAYRSVISGAPGRIKIEAGLREPVHAVVTRDALCLLLDPTSGQAAVLPVPVRTMGLEEALAEKARAAFARLAPAIRDLFDLWHAHQARALPMDDARFIRLVRAKLAVPGNAPAAVSPQRREAYRAQIETILRPVLRPVDFARFNFDEAWGLVEALGRRVISE